MIAYSVGLRPLAGCDRGFESHPGLGCVVCCECCVLSGRGLCDELITRPGSPPNCGASLYVIMKPRKRGG